MADEEQKVLDLTPTWITGGGDAVELHLPWPPSANHYKGYRAIKPKGKKRHIVIAYLTEKAKEYHENVASIVLRDGAVRHFKGPLSMKVIAHPPDRRIRDLSNLYKMLEDSLQKAGVYEDDHQIEEHYSQRRREPVKGGLLVVRIEELV